MRQFNANLQGTFGGLDNDILDLSHLNGPPEPSTGHGPDFDTVWEPRPFSSPRTVAPNSPDGTDNYRANDRRMMVARATLCTGRQAITQGSEYSVQY